MDAPAKRLTKEPPPPSLPTPSRSLRTKPSGTLLKRNPSAPVYPQLSPASNPDHQRTYSINTSSNSSLEQPTPSAGSSEFGSHGQINTYNIPYRTSLRGSDELNSSSSDGLGAFKPNTSLNSPRRPPLPPAPYTSPDPRMLTPSLRQSASFSNGERTFVDLTPPRSDTGLTGNSKRYSDEANGGKVRWRKKSGIAGFVNSMLGSPRNVKIGAPENPVHMIHVGYDNETGQFTVGTDSCPLTSQKTCSSWILSFFQFQMRLNEQC
jgi:p21-activated kinase 1